MHLHNLWDEVQSNGFKAEQGIPVLPISLVGKSSTYIRTLPFAFST